METTELWQMLPIVAHLGTVHWNLSYYLLLNITWGMASFSFSCPPILTTLLKAKRVIESMHFTVIRFRSTELSQTHVYSPYSQWSLCGAVDQSGLVGLNNPKLMTLWNYPIVLVPSEYKGRRRFGKVETLRTHNTLPDRPGSLCNRVVRSCLEVLHYANLMLFTL